MTRLLDDPALMLIALSVVCLAACAFMGAWLWLWPRLVREGRAIAALFRAFARSRRRNYPTDDLRRSLDRAEAKHARSPIDA